MKTIDHFTKSPFSLKFTCLYHEFIHLHFHRHFTLSATDEVGVLHPAVCFITQLSWLMKEEKGKGMF